MVEQILDFCVSTQTPRTYVMLWLFFIQVTSYNDTWIQVSNMEHKTPKQEKDNPETWQRCVCMYKLQI